MVVYRTPARWLAAVMLVAVASGCGPDSGGPTVEGQVGGEAETTAAPPPTIGTAVVTDVDRRLADAACAFARSRQQRVGRSVVFLATDATPDQIAGVRAALERDPAVTELEHTDQEAALAEAHELFADSPGLQLRPDQLPSSFRFRVTDGPAQRVVAAIEHLPGVREVVVARQPACDESDAEAIAAKRRATANRFGEDGDAIVFLDPTKPEALSLFEQAVLRLDVVRGVVVVSPEEALEELRCLFWDKPDTRSVTSRDLPPSLRLTFTDEPHAAEAVTSVLEKMPGIRTVATRPSDAEIVQQVLYESTDGADPASQPDCPVEGQRVR